MSLSESSRIAWGVVVVFAAGLLSPGCNKKVDTGNIKPADVEADSWPSPSDAECEQFARDMEKAARSGVGSQWNAMIDWDVLLQKATGGIDGIDNMRDGFIRGAKSGLNNPNNLGQQIVDAVTQSGSYEFVRVRGRNKRKRVLMRFILPEDGGLNYHEMILAKRPDGEVKAIDIYIYLTAETLSTTMRRLFLPIVASQQRNLLEKLAKKDNEFVKHASKLQQMTQAIHSGRPEETMRLYKSLPESIRNEKVFLLVRLQAAMQMGDREHTQAIEAFRKHYPKDPCIDMLSIDGHILKKEFDQALACVDRLDESVGGDPYLNVIRAGIEVETGNHTKAYQLVEQAIAELPKLEQAYWTIVTITLQDKNYDKTVYWLNQIRDRLNIQLGDLRQIPDFRAFVQSEEYRKWRSGQ